MSESATLLAAVYPNQEHAKVILDMLQRMNRAGTIRVIDATLVTKDEQGKMVVEETKEVTTRKGARRGALIMGSLGLLFPPSLIASALVGGAIGALSGRVRDTGIKNKQMREFAERLEPGKAIVVALVDNNSVVKAQPALEGYEGSLLITAIDAETLDEIHREAATRADSRELDSSPQVP